MVAIGMSFHSDSIFYRSEALRKIALNHTAGEYWIRDDQGQRVEIIRMEDGQGVSYWHRRIKTEVCQTGECKLIDVGLYWDCTGDFFGLDVYGEHLTKTDHSIFSEDDYEFLISILSNDWSILREYEFSDLTVEGKNQDVDATSGATRKEIASEAVKDAVYTTYTLWHLVHNGEKEQLEILTAGLLQDESMVRKLQSVSEKRYDYFLLSLLAQNRILHSESLDRLVLHSLAAKEDPLKQDLALKALAGLDSNDPTFQAQIASMYAGAARDLKLRMLTSLRDISQVHEPFSTALADDLDGQNEWLAAKILPLLAKGASHSEATLKTVRDLSHSENVNVRQSAIDFLSMHN